jgi:outer membrane protein TolC
MPRGPLGLADCIRVALANHASRRIADADIEVAEALQKKARSAYWPQISFSSKLVRLHEDASFVFEGEAFDLSAQTEAMADAVALSQLVNAGLAPQPGNPVFDAAYANAKAQVRQQMQASELPDIEVKIADRDSWANSLSGYYPLFTGGKISAANERADIGVEAARARWRLTREEIAFRVTKMYLATMLAKELLRLGEEARTRFRVILDITERVYQTGSGTVKKTDYLKTKVFTGTVEGQVHVIEKQLGIVQAALRNAIGVEPEADIVLADDGLRFTDGDFEEATLLAAAFRDREEWKLVRLGVSAAEAGVEEAESGYWPRVALFGSVSHLANTYDKGITDFAEKAWAFGVQLELPVFKGFATDAEVARAEAELRRNRHREDLLEKGIRTQIRTGLLKLQAARGELESSERSLKDAEENRALNLRAYEAELVETQDVIEAQLLETLTKARYFRALYTANLAVAELQLAAGQLLAEAGG